MTGTSAAVPLGALPSKSLGASGELGASQAQAEAASGVAQRSTSQRATSFVGTADYVAPEVPSITRIDNFKPNDVKVLNTIHGSLTDMDVPCGTLTLYSAHDTSMCVRLPCL